MFKRDVAARGDGFTRRIDARLVRSMRQSSGTQHAPELWWAQIWGTRPASFIHAYGLHKSDFKKQARSDGLESSDFRKQPPTRTPFFFTPSPPIPRRRRTTDPKPSLEPFNEYNRCLLLFRHNSRPGRGWDNSRRGHIRRCRRCRRPLSVRPAHICYLGVFIYLLYIGEQSKFKIFVLVRPSVYSGSCNISTINIIYII